MRCLSLTALLFALTCTCASAGQPADALLGHWTFDTPAGDVARDASGAGRDAEIAGAVPVEGALGGALRFDGKDDYVALGDFGEFEAVTVAFWLKAEEFEADEGFHGLVTSDAWEEGVIHLPIKEGKIDVYLHLGEKARGRLTSRRLKNDTWYHVAVVADSRSGLLRLFVNGGEQDVADISGLAGKIKLVEQVVGREHDGEKHARHFDGAIDDVRIYGRALDVREIQELCPEAVPLADRDPRNIRTGRVIPDEGYCDQPYVVITKDGNWLCLLTTGKGHEGSSGQHFVATISKDQGKTWGPLIDIEPADGPEASYGVPLVVPSGRVYAIYTYNGDRIRSLPGSTRKIRADMLGWYCFRYSDDNGKTWSHERYRIPLRVTACDLANQWKGEVQIFWGIDKPKISDMGVTFCITKLGKYMLDNGEGWMLHSDNILTEPDPQKINWNLLPDGEHGLRAPEFGSIQEEHNHVPLGKNRLYLVYRTTTGYPCHTYSDDGGHTWSQPEHMTYTPDGRKIKNPRACPKLWRCENGKYLFWFHFNGTKTFGKIYDESLGSNRNPVWITGGVVRDGKMHWSEPEILLYHNDPKQKGMSYPDLIEQDGQYWVTETQKTVARVHKVDPTLLEGLWAQHEGKGEVTRKGLAMSLDGKAVEAESAKMPHLPDLTETNSGFTLDVRLKRKDMESGQVILDSRNDKGRGVVLKIAENGSVQLRFFDGTNKAGVWTSDPGLLKASQTHHVTAIVDGGPNIITFVVDGKLCDGGDSRRYGWGRFSSKVGDINGSDKLRLSPSFDGELLGLRIYDRYLRTSEAVANHQADGQR